jgi:hypothetical protein
MELYNIDNDIKEEDQISVTINSTKYIITMVISYSLGCYLLNNKDTILEIFANGTGKPSLSKATLDFAYTICLELLKEQDPELLTDAYLKKHLSVTKLIIMLIKMAKPFYEYMTLYGPSLIGAAPAPADAKGNKKKA